MKVLRQIWGLFLPEERLIGLIALSAAVSLYAIGQSFQLSRIIDGYSSMFGFNLALLFTATRLRHAWRRKRGAATGNVDFSADITLLRSTAFLFAYLTVYSNIKARIPILNPEFHDEALRRFETTLSGVDLVERASTLRSSPALMGFLDDVYHHDYIFMTLSVFLLMDRELLGLRRLVTAMGLLYLLGVLITVAWPTLGPCFADRGAFTWISEQGLQSWSNQEWLLKTYRATLEAEANGLPVSGRAFVGIAALPSLHVGHCMLLCRAAWTHHRRLLLLYIPVTLLTWLATLVFGWHYLSDGLASIPLVFLSWWLAGRVVGTERTLPGDPISPGAHS